MGILKWHYVQFKTKPGRFGFFRDVMRRGAAVRCEVNGACIQDRSRLSSGLQPVLVRPRSRPRISCLVYFIWSSGVPGCGDRCDYCRDLAAAMIGPGVDMRRGRRGLAGGDRGFRTIRRPEITLSNVGRDEWGPLRRAARPGTRMPPPSFRAGIGYNLPNVSHVPVPLCRPRKRSPVRMCRGHRLAPAADRSTEV